MAKTEVKLPDLGEGVTEGELVKWLVKVGDSVKADQPIAELMTDKATVEFPSSMSGTVVELRAKPGDVVPVGQVMFVVEVSGAGAAAAAAKAPVKEPGASASAKASNAPAPTRESAGALSASPEKSGEGGGTGTGAEGRSPAPVRASAGGNGMDVYPPVAESRVLATPSTRRLAREMNIDINHLQGTGLAGRVTREDIGKSGNANGNGHSDNDAGAGATAAGSPNFQIARPAYSSQQGNQEERVAIRGIRKKIAEKMQMSKHIIPHFTLMDEANVTELVKWRTDMKEQAAKVGVKVTYLPFVMKALIATIRQFPMFNASIDDAAQEIVYKKYFNLGFAADTPQGLVVPVIKDADRKTVLELSREINQLSEKARAGKLSAEEMKGATISVTNIGSVGGTYATPIINHPEVAILGMYKISEKPIFVGDEIQKAYVMNITITADHRLIDGAVAANFLKAFLQRLENPSLIVLDLA
jgi:pyruvate dehydrogenase E2 component (dihydrolipoamide acetyltransferase)